MLAGELHRCGADHAAAFSSYQAIMKPFLIKKQLAAANFASAFAPRTTFGIHFRNLITRLLRIPFVADFFVSRDLRDDIKLPDYEY